MEYMTFLPIKIVSIRLRFEREKNQLGAKDKGYLVNMASSSV